MPLGTVSREAPWWWVELGSCRGVGGAGCRGGGVLGHVFGGGWPQLPFLHLQAPLRGWCVEPDWNSSAELVLKIVTDVCHVSVTPNALLKMVVRGCCCYKPMFTVLQCWQGVLQEPTTARSRSDCGFAASAATGVVCFCSTRGSSVVVNMSVLLSFCCCCLSAPSWSPDGRMSVLLQLESPHVLKLLWEEAGSYSLASATALSFSMRIPCPSLCLDEQWNPTWWVLCTPG